MALQKTCIGQVTKYLTISHITAEGLVTLVNQNLEYSVLTLQDIHYFMALNLIYIDLDWIVGLKGSDFLEIAPLGQRLISLIINDNHESHWLAWRSSSNDARLYTCFASPSIHGVTLPLLKYEHAEEIPHQTLEP